MLEKRQNKKNKGFRRTRNVADEILYSNNLRAFPKQALATIWVPIAPITYSTTVTTGVIAAVQTMDSSQVTNWATRFEVFDEYRVVRVEVEILTFSTVNPGVINCWFDEDSSAAPTATGAQERATKRFAASSASQTHKMVWIPRDINDMIFNPIASGSGEVNFNLYTNNTNFGSSIVATPYVTVSAYLLVQFRGLALV
jgi:hypothetical protein